jgi:hypothetical protein
MMLKLAYEDVSKNSLNSLEQMDDFSMNIDKFTTFCRRVINMQKLDFELGTSYYLILVRVNTMARKLNFAYHELSKNKSLRFNKKIVSLMKSLYDMNVFYVDMFYKKNIKGISEIKKMRNKIMDGCNAYLFSEKGPENILVSAIIEMCGLCQRNAGPFVSIVI